MKTKKFTTVAMPAGVSDRISPIEEAVERDTMIEEKKERVKILKLLERWDGPNNEYRIGAEPLSTSTWHISQVLLGPECKTMEEIERVVADIRTDLDEILVEARDKIALQNSN
jgi:hypothetical protein